MGGGAKMQLIESIERRINEIVAIQEDQSTQDAQINLKLIVLQKQIAELIASNEYKLPNEYSPAIYPEEYITTFRKIYKCTPKDTIWIAHILCRISIDNRGIMYNSDANPSIAVAYYNPTIKETPNFIYAEKHLHNRIISNHRELKDLPVLSTYKILKLRKRLSKKYRHPLSQPQNGFYFNKLYYKTPPALHEQLQRVKNIVGCIICECE